MPTVRKQKRRSPQSRSTGGSSWRGARKNTAENVSTLYGPDLPYSPLPRTIHEAEARLPSHIVSLEMRYRHLMYCV